MDVQQALQHMGVLLWTTPARQDAQEYVCVCRRIVKVPADAMAHTKHVIGVLPLGIDTADAKDNPDSVLLRFPDQQQVTSSP